MAMSSGIPVISTTRARQSPIAAPTTMATTSSPRPRVEMPPSIASAIVASRATVMPTIPKVFPALAES